MSFGSREHDERTAHEERFDLTAIIERGMSGEAWGLRALVERFAWSYDLEAEDGWGILAQILLEAGHGEGEPLVERRWYGRCRFYLLDGRGGAKARSMMMRFVGDTRRTDAKVSRKQECTVAEARLLQHTVAVSDWLESNADHYIEADGQRVDRDVARARAIRRTEAHPDDRNVQAVRLRLLGFEDGAIGEALGISAASVRTYVSRGRETIADPLDV